MTLSYDKIFSRFMMLVTDYTLAQLPDDDQESLEVEWLYAAISEPRVRQKFSALQADDMMREVEFTLRMSIDEFADTEYVTRILSLGMAIAWLQSQVDSVVHTAPFIGGKEEKKILDNHTESIARLESMKNELKKTLRDYGYYYNTYLEGGA